MDPCLKLQLTGDPEEVLLLLVRLQSPELVPPNCRIVTQFGDIVTCRIKRKHLIDLYQSPTTRSVKAARVIPATHREDIVQEASEVGLARPSRLVNAPYTGRGIYFAAVDWGFDFAHKNLCWPDGRTRFACIWDQGGIYDGNAYGYGCMYTEEEINEALRSDTPYQTLGYHPGRTDLFGQGMHGTHVLDIAAGTRMVGEGGIAPGTRLVGVQLGSSAVNGSDLALGDSVRLVEALDFIHQSTLDAPCVINMSLGSHGDSHTGRSLVEIAFDNFLSVNPGYALVQSVGNYYTANCHIHHTLEQGQEYHIEWNIPFRNRVPNEAEIWYPGDDEFSITIIAPDGETVADINPFEDIRISYRGDPIGYVLQRKNEPNTGLNHIDILLDVTVLTGKWIIEITGRKVVNGNFHAFCERNDVNQARFSAHQSTSYTTTGSVCNGTYTITVGAYNHNDGRRRMVAFSSSGPTLLGQPKPDLLAPGFKIRAARSAPPTAYDALHGLTVKSGSSMAAPHVSGSIALLFEKHLPQRLSVTVVKQLLRDALDPHPTDYSDADRSRAGGGLLNTDLLFNDKKAFMPLRFDGSAVTEDLTVEENLNGVETIEHDAELEVAGPVESTVEDYESWLSGWQESFEEGDPFITYRHFHPGYAFSRSPSDSSVVTVALPGSRITNQLQPGDLVIRRDALTNSTRFGVLVAPQWAQRDGMNGMTHHFKKPGWYLKVYGDLAGNGNELAYVPAAAANGRVHDTVVILRKNYSSNGPAAFPHIPESGIYLSETAGTAPPALLQQETDPPAETLYVHIDLGLRTECSRLENKTYTCIEKLKYDVEAKTGIFIPALATAKSKIDLLLYLHGHKSGYVKSGKDLPVDALWNRKQLPEFSFRELLNESGKDLILVAPTLGPLSQAGSLLTSAGFTQFIDQVILSIAQYSNLYKGKTAPQIQSITLAAHSGGGIRMRSIASLAGSNAYAGLIKECWGFDCTYTKNDPQVWRDWAVANPDKALYLYSIKGSQTAKLADQLKAPSMMVQNIHVIDASTGVHNLVPKVHMKERLTGQKPPVTPGKSSGGTKGAGILKGSVGKGGQNQGDDVLTVQTLLNNAAIPIPLSGQVASHEGDATVLAIFHYQKRKKLPYYDGKVDPNGVTIRSLLQHAGGGKALPAPPAPTPPGPVPVPPGPLPIPPIPSDPVLEAELLTHPAILSRYKNSAAYKKVRDQVVTWRTGKPPRAITDPAGYIEQALQQWNAQPQIHGYFNYGFDGKPNGSYLNLKRLYEEKGISDPAAYFKDNIVNVQFFNKKTPAHKDLAAVLNKAQASLIAAGNQYTFANAWSFVPRTVNFNINQLSDHALGKAIDINHETNPHIRDKGDVKVIDAVCRHLLPGGLYQQPDPDILRKASEHFQQTFNEAWIAGQTDPALLTVLSKKENRQRLNGYAKHGFLTLPTPLIRALQNAGLQWGGSWTSAKDFMHFQLPGA